MQGTNIFIPKFSITLPYNAHLPTTDSNVDGTGICYMEAPLYIICVFSAFIVMDKYSDQRRSRGYGFVTFEQKGDAEDCIRFRQRISRHKMKEIRQSLHMLCIIKDFLALQQHVSNPIKRKEQSCIFHDC